MKLKHIVLRIRGEPDALQAADVIQSLCERALRMTNLLVDPLLHGTQNDQLRNSFELESDREGTAQVAGFFPLIHVGEPFDVVVVDRQDEQVSIDLEPEDAGVVLAEAEVPRRRVIVGQGNRRNQVERVRIIANVVFRPDGLGPHAR